MTRKSDRGFAAMDEEEQREISRRGGRASHEQGAAHQWDARRLARAACRGGPDILGHCRQQGGVHVRRCWDSSSPRLEL